MSWIQKRGLSNYAINPLSQKKMFYTPFCMKNYWEATVLGDALEVLIFVRDTLEKNMTLDELVSDKSYIRKINITHDQLVKNGCELVIN